MFGLLKPCSHAMDDELTDQWRQHLCGLCLGLRNGHGHAARLTTNTDAVMISILTAAQQDSTAETTVAGRCPLRGMRRAEVITADNAGIRLAGTAPLTLAAAKASDVRAEQRLGLAPPSRVRRQLAGVAAGTLTRHAAADPAGLDVDGVLRTLATQADTECSTTSLTALTTPTARATAAVFAATAEAADVAGNREALAAIGHDFGTLAHLLDAIDDHAEDAESGSFNPLTASGTDIPTALSLCRALSTAIRQRYDDLVLADDRLLRVVLLGGIRHAIGARMQRFSPTERPQSTTSPQPATIGASPGYWPPERPSDLPSYWPPERPGDFPAYWPYPPPFSRDRRFSQRIGPFLLTGVPPGWWTPR